MQKSVTPAEKEEEISEWNCGNDRKGDKKKEEGNCGQRTQVITTLYMEQNLPNVV